MRLTPARSRYITICQQFLVTAVVVTVGLSAAGVMTLQIVSPESAGDPADPALGMAPAIDVTQGYAATRAVTPKVREIKVVGLKKKAPAPGAPAKTAGRKTAGKAVAQDSKKAARTLAAVSEPTAVHGFATVGVTWKSGTELAEDDIAVQVRTRKDGTWSSWQTADYHDEHGPDAGTAEADHATRPGTDPVVVGDVDQVQMRAETADGVAPADLELAVIDPGASKVVKEPAAIDTAKLPADDRDATSSAPIESTAGLRGSGEVASHGDGAATSPDAGSGDIALSAMKIAPKPTIYSRAQWGANEKLRDKSSLRYGTVKTGFIHHTVNANDYTAEQVPALLRGIYAYHTQSRGWSDIGYNYLVDRFGRIWEGRFGGVDRAVVGAHTLGFNEYAFAMSAIGNFDIAQPPQAVLTAYAKLFAWKLSLYNIRADAPKLYVKDRYLHAINGHRDVGKTACPGKYLYAKIPSIRTAAQAIQGGSQTPTDPVNLPVIAPPDGLVSPQAKPLAATNQAKVTLPVRRSVAGSSWPDLLVKSATGQVSVVPTEGILSYAGKVVSKGDWSKRDLITAVGDVTGDGRTDVVARDPRSGVAKVYAGDGSGHVSTSGTARTLRFAGLRDLIGVGDFNRDGRSDVVGIDRKTGALQLFKGLGKGVFSMPTTLARKWPFEHTTGVGNFNSDKNPDLVVTASRAVYVVPGAAGGKIGKPVRIASLPADVADVFGWGDLTGDGIADVVVRNAGSGLASIYAGTGKGGKVGRVYGPFSSLNGLSWISMGPMAGTAAADMVGRDAGGHLVVVPNNGRKNLGRALPSNLKLPGASQILSVGDWDKSGTSDVVMRTSDRKQLVLFPGLGNGKFGRPRSLGLGWEKVTYLAPVGDVTGDGYPDLIGRVGTGPMTIFPGSGNRAFRAPVLAPATLRTFNQVGGSPWSTRGGTFSSADGTFVPYAGSGTSGTALRAANGSATSAYDTYVGVGDANGDGVADLLAREKGTGTIWLLPGKTSGGLGPRMWVADGFAGYRLIG